MRKLWVLLLVSFPGLAPGASFNCAKGTTPQEKAICGSPALNKADDELAAAYRGLVGSSPEGIAAEIRQDQRDWLKWLSAWCGYATKMSGQAWADCMLDPYQQRVERLKKASLRVGGVEFVERAITRYRLDDSETFDSRDWKFNFATLTASWPVARNDAPEWKAWNDAVEKAARGMQENDHAPPGQVPAWEAPEGADSDITVEISLLTSRLVVAQILNFWDGHGAHPNQVSTQFNWLLQ